MEASELLQELGKNIAKSTNVASWSNAKFTKSHEVYLGVDFEEPPDESHYPIIIIYNIHETLNISDRESFTVEIGIGLVKEELVVLDSGIPNLFSYTGLELLTEFRKLIEIEVLKSARSLHAKISTESESIPDVFYPLFSASITAKIEIPRGYRKPY